MLHAAWLSGEAKPNNLEASIAKAKGGADRAQPRRRAASSSWARWAISREHLLEKWFRDVRITDIYEGTGQIQPDHRARHPGLPRRRELS